VPDIIPLKSIFYITRPIKFVSPLNDLNTIYLSLHLITINTSSSVSPLLSKTIPL